MRITTAFLVLSSLSAVALADDITVSMADGVLDTSDRTKPAPVRPTQVSVTLDEAAPDGFPALPDGLTGVGHGFADVGGAKVALAVAATGKGGADRLLLDTNGDGEFAADEVLSPEFANPRGTTYVAQVKSHTLAIAGKTLAPNVTAVWRAPDQPWSVYVMGTWFRTGTFKVGDAEYALDLVDGDLDGAYDGEKDRWYVRAAGPVKRSATPYVLQPKGGGLFADGRRFVLTGLADGTATLTAAAAEGPHPDDVIADRTRVEHIWSERFDKEREKFVEQREMDTTRPRAETPIAWRWVTFAEAKELSAAESKPLFVDVLAFWCVWCYRMDYYTYVDAEVTARLNEDFIPVKIIQEQDSAGEYKAIMEELGARGIPAMGVWNPAGDLVHKIGGWKKPADFLAELATALEAVKAGPADDPVEEPETPEAE